MIKPLFECIDSQDFTNLKSVLSHSSGYNRSQAPKMLQADNDAEAIAAFLLEYKDSKLSYRSYLKEIERLALWCVNVLKLTISDLKREHFTAYREFLANPEPRVQWCGPRKPRMTADGHPNPEWRPFAAPLSPATIKKVTSVLDSFFNYLVQNNHLAGNPLAVDKRRKHKKLRFTDRWLERDEILAVLTALDEAEKQPSSQNPYEMIRARYIILTLFYTGLRLNELTTHRMGNFVLIGGEWYLNVIGKGQKPRKIAVVDEYLDALVRFRTQLGFSSPLPQFEESTPLICMENGINPISNSRVWQIFKWACALGATHYETLALQSQQEKNFNCLYKASKLRRASPHWLRHSYGTYLVKSGCAIEKVKELMGHSDISTTMLYVHTVQNDLHAAARDLSLQETNFS